MVLNIQYSLYKTLLANAAINYRSVIYIKLLLTFCLIKSFHFKKKKATDLQVKLLATEYYSSG